MKNHPSNHEDLIKPSKINGRYILDEIRSVLNFEKGFLYTVRELILRPGLSIRKFILEDRTRLVKPILFLIICSLIYSIPNDLNNSTGNESSLDDWGQFSMSLLNWISENDGYANLILVVFIALWLKIFFKKYGFNFYEIIVALSYIAGIQVLITTIFETLKLILNIEIPLYGLVAQAYGVWAIARFFNKRKISSYVLSLISLFLGISLFISSLFGLAELIDLI